MTPAAEANGAPLAGQPAPTVVSADLVYDGEPPLDDAAENYHEASKLYPAFGRRQTRGYLLEMRADVSHSTTRGIKRYRAVPRVELPEASLPDVSLAQAISMRRTQREFAEEPIELGALSSLLHAGYGVTHELNVGSADRPSFSCRSVPSGGALYPLELYVIAFTVEGLEPGLFHFDPGARRLDQVRAVPVETLRAEVAEAAVYAEVATTAAALVAVTGMFWRTRFKYGLRGYRFALLEAGHVVQNAVLAATDLGLPALPLGGFYDRLLDGLVGADSLDEATVHAFVLGGAA